MAISRDPELFQVCSKFSNWFVILGALLLLVDLSLVELVLLPPCVLILSMSPEESNGAYNLSYISYMLLIDIFDEAHASSQPVISHTNNLNKNYIRNIFCLKVPVPSRVKQFVALFLSQDVDLRIPKFCVMFYLAVLCLVKILNHGQLGMKPKFVSTEFVASSHGSVISVYQREGLNQLWNY